MNPVALLALAAAAWWLYKRQASPKGTTPQLAARSTVFTHQGRTYRVVGEPTPDGLVPVQYQPPAGTMALAVVQFYDPATGSIVAGPSFVE